jgi:NAD(P)-dependent dehydrogenase (short-subunit alcohol dehydrogenase family)
VKALLFGASGGLATAVAERLLARGWQVDLVSRKPKAGAVRKRFDAKLRDGRAQLFIVEKDYPEFDPVRSYDAYFFMQALFAPCALAEMEESRIEAEIRVGLTGHILLTRKLIAMHPPLPNERKDFCYIGSTSAYAGFRNTSVYCAVKHGLLGFIRAMNDEYCNSDVRFWLFSMGTMNTEMGALLVDQDSTSFLQPEDVADRIIAAVTSASNVFEPEAVMRRRSIRFLERK